MLLTNKIPGFRQTNWYLVTGANALYVDSDKEYIEVFAGFENILKIARLDFVWGFDKDKVAAFGIRLGIRGFGRL